MNLLSFLAAEDSDIAVPGGVLGILILVLVILAIIYLIRRA